MALPHPGTAPLPPVEAAGAKLTRRPGSDPSVLPRTIQIRGVAYDILTEDEPGSVPLSEDAKLALVELSKNPSDEGALRRYRTDPSIRVSARRFADKFALQGTPILDEHDHAKQVGIITLNCVENGKLIIDAELNDPAAIKRVVDGEYTGLSIGYKPHILGDGNVVHTVREVSVCSEPYFTDCLLTEIQATAQRLAAATSPAADGKDSVIPHFALISIVPAPEGEGSASKDRSDADALSAMRHAFKSVLERQESNGEAAAGDDDAAMDVEAKEGGEMDAEATATDPTSVDAPAAANDKVHKL